MDRAKELRQMMKTAGRKDEPSGGSASLSGKDKLKMMRDLKQQKAEAAAPPPPRPSMSKPATAPMKTIDPKDTKFMEEWKKSSSILPAGFFDGGAKPAAVAKPVVPAVQQSKPPVATTVSPSNKMPYKSDSTTAKPKTASSVPPTASSTANLPMEFFDNAREELVARGVNLKQHILDQKKEADKEFESFLNEIDEIKEVVDEEVVAEVQDEAALKEFEEQAIQMAYMAKLAVLYNKSDAVVGATAPRVVTNVDDQQIENSMLEMDSVIASNSSSSGAVVDASSNSVDPTNAPSGAVKVRQDVEDILYRKLQMEKLKKRKLQLFSQSIKDSIQKESSESNSSSHSNKRQATEDNRNAGSAVDKQKSESEANDEEGEEEDESSSEEDEEEEDVLDYSDLNYSLWKN